MDETSFMNSYGIIMFRVDNHNKIQYCVVKRRDTIEYVSLIRGYYNDSNIPVYVQYLTSEEKEKLLNWSFDQLWDDFWCNHSCWSYLNTKKDSEKLYNANIDTIKYNIMQLPIDHIENSSRLWSFPKGKRKKTEYSSNYVYPLNQNLICAIREFTEETSYPIAIHDIIDSIPPSYEIIQGTDSLTYQTTYYFAIANTMYEPKIMERNKTIEITEVAWKTFNELKSMVDINKQKFIASVHRKVHEYVFSL